MKKKTTQTIWPWCALILAVIVFAIGGYFYLNQEQTSYPLPAEDITVAVSKLEATTLVRVALENGYFKKHGLNVTMTEQDLGKFSLKEVFEGRADIATVAETPVVKNAFNRDDYQLFATIHESSTNAKLIGLKEHGIESAEDLRGKKIGTTVGTVGEYFLSSFLLHSGMGTNDIELVDERPAALTEMLMAGEIDAFALREPHVFRAQEVLGDNATVFAQDNIYTATFDVVAMTAFIEKNPQIIERFLQALLEAEEFVKDHREEAIDLVSESLLLNRDYLDETWEESIFELSLTQNLLVTMEHEARWVVDSGAVDSVEIPNYLQYLYFDAIEEVKPDSLTIIR